MLVVVTASASPMPVDWISSNIKVVVKSKIVEALTEAGIGDAEEILIEVLPSRVENTNNEANGAYIDEVATARSPKGEVSV